MGFPTLTWKCESQRWQCSKKNTEIPDWASSDLAGAKNMFLTFDHPILSSIQFCWVIYWCTLQRKPSNMENPWRFPKMVVILKSSQNTAFWTILVWKPMETYGNLWKPMETYGNLWKLMVTWGSPMTSPEARPKDIARSQATTNTGVPREPCGDAELKIGPSGGFLKQRPKRKHTYQQKSKHNYIIIFIYIYT